MSAAWQSASMNSSVSAVSSQFDSREDPESYTVKNHVKESLKSRIFLGRYLERRLANNKVGYRDVVLISAAEVELKSDLLEALRKLRNITPSSHWIGISETDALGYHTPGVCLWTEIDNQPFGLFWFQIKSLKFRDEEIIVAIKCIRHISDAFLEVEPILTGTEKKSKAPSENKHADSAAPINEAYADFVGTLKTFLSITNVKEFITFLFAFIIAVFTGSTAFVNFLGNFVLALMREFSILVKNSTPMFLGLLDFFSKIIGGFYILLAMLFKQSAPAPSNKRSVGYYDRSQRKQPEYYDNQFD